MYKIIAETRQCTEVSVFFPGAKPPASVSWEDEFLPRLFELRAAKFDALEATCLPGRVSCPCCQGRRAEIEAEIFERRAKLGLQADALVDRDAVERSSECFRAGIRAVRRTAYILNTPLKSLYQVHILTGNVDFSPIECMKKYSDYRDLRAQRRTSLTLDSLNACIQGLPEEKKKILVESIWSRMEADPCENRKRILSEDLELSRIVPQLQLGIRSPAFVAKIELMLMRMIAATPYMEGKLWQSAATTVMKEEDALVFGHKAILFRGDQTPRSTSLFPPPGSSRKHLLCS